MGAMPAPAELEINDDLVPLRRPQLRLDGESVFFLASQRPLTTLEAADVAVWSAIDGRRTIGDLAAEFDDARARLSAMWRRELIELAEGAFPADRTPILIVEPHMDDAVLSLGATMWARRHEAEMTVLTVSSISNYTSYHKLFRGVFDIDDITALRRAESETILRLLGGRLETLDRVDAALRYHHANWTAEWFRENSKAVSAYVNHSLPPEAVENLAQTLVARFKATDARELWFPMGIGRSADHELTRDACLRALELEPGLLDRMSVNIYQEVPYLGEFPDHRRRVVATLNSAGGKADLVWADVADSLPWKFRLVSIFASQFKGTHMNPKVAACAQASGAEAGVSVAESWYRVHRLPKLPLPEALYSGAPDIAAIQRRLRAWYPRARRARRLRVLCPTAVGCWREDMSVLLDAFPEATIEMHMAPAALGEADRLVSERIVLKPVSGGARAWAERALRLLLAPRQPLIVVTSFKLSRLSNPLRLALFFAPVLPVASIDNLVAALRREPSASG